MKTPSKEQISRWLSMVIHDGGQLAFIPSSGMQLEITAYFNDPATTGRDSLNKPFINKMREKLEQELLNAFLEMKQSAQQNVGDVTELKNELARAVDMHSQAIFVILGEFEIDQLKSSNSPRSTAPTFRTEANRTNARAALYDSKINIIEWVQESLSGTGLSPLSAASKGGLIGFAVGFTLAALFLFIFATSMGGAFIAGVIIATAIVGSIVGAIGTKFYYESQAKGYEEDMSLGSNFSQKHTEEFNDVFSPHHSDEDTPPKPHGSSSPYSNASSTLDSNTTSPERNRPKNTRN